MMSSLKEELNRLAAQLTERELIFSTPVKHLTIDELHCFNQLSARVDEIMPREAIVNIINQKENDMNNAVKNVLFLAPGYQYAMTVIANQSKELDRKKIPYNASKDPKNLYISTDKVHVEIVYMDPVKWTVDLVKNRDAIFGKKELIDKARDAFHTVIVFPRPGMSLSKYISDRHSTKETEPVKPREIYIPEIKNAYFNDPVTVVMWEDGTKTMVRCQNGDVYSPETGLALCIAKKALGNMPNFNNVFKKWISETKEQATKEETSELDKIEARAKAIANETMTKYKEARKNGLS